MTRAEAADALHLLPERIGRSGRPRRQGHRVRPPRRRDGADAARIPHAWSLHELDVPIVIHNACSSPHAAYFRHNLDLARWLYPLEATAGAERPAVPA